MPGNIHYFRTSSNSIHLQVECTPNHRATQLRRVDCRPDALKLYQTDSHFRQGRLNPNRGSGSADLVVGKSNIIGAYYALSRWIVFQAFRTLESGHFVGSFRIGELLFECSSLGEETP